MGEKIGPILSFHAKDVFLDCGRSFDEDLSRSGWCFLGSRWLKESSERIFEVWTQRGIRQVYHLAWIAWCTLQGN